MAGVLRDHKTLDELARDEKNEAEAKLKREKTIQDAMYQTATTIFSFRQAWDSVTRSVQKAIAPFTDMIGLTKNGRIQAKFFTDMFKRLNDGLKVLAQNKSVQHFFSHLGENVNEVIRSIDKFVSSGKLDEWITTVTKSVQGFYNGLERIVKFVADSVIPVVEPFFKFLLDNSKTIMAIWGAVTVGKGLVNIGLAGKAFIDLLGPLQAVGGAANNLASGMTKMAGAVGVGGALGTIVGEHLVKQPWYREAVVRAVLTAKEGAAGALKGDFGKAGEVWAKTGEAGFFDKARAHAGLTSADESQPQPQPMAKGGIVRRPTYALLGEDGAEKVTPLNHGHGGGGGDVRYVPVAGDVYIDGTKVGRHIIRKILEPEVG
jgi:hypothetical protein